MRNNTLAVILYLSGIEPKEMNQTNEKEGCGKHISFILNWEFNSAFLLKKLVKLAALVQNTDVTYFFTSGDGTQK